MKYELIKKVMAIKKVSTSSLCKELGMTDHGYRAMMRNKTMKVDTLEKICNLLKISPVELLDVEPLESAGIGIALLELDRIKEKIDIIKEDLQAAKAKKTREPFTPIPRDPFNRTRF
jgi:DNA-binding Xre family transcriptional regulator